MYRRKRTLSAELFEQAGEMFGRGLAPLILGGVAVLLVGIYVRWTVGYFLTNPDFFLLGLVAGLAGVGCVIAGGALLISALFLVPIGLVVWVWEWISGGMGWTRK